MHLTGRVPNYHLYTLVLLDGYIFGVYLEIIGIVDLSCEFGFVAAGVIQLDNLLVVFADLSGEVLDEHDWRLMTHQIQVVPNLAKFRVHERDDAVSSLHFQG